MQLKKTSIMFNRLYLGNITNYTIPFSHIQMSIKLQGNENNKITLLNSLLQVTQRCLAQTHSTLRKENITTNLVAFHQLW